MNHRSLSLRRILLTALMLTGLLANNVSIALATNVSGLLDADAIRPPVGQQRLPLPPATDIPPLFTPEGPGAENKPPDPVTPPFSPTLDFPPAFRPTRPFTIPAAYSGTLPTPARPTPDFQPPMFDNRLPYTENRSATGLSVCGSIVVNTVWTTANSPYQVTCDVGVSAGVTLTIQAGVTVQFEHTGDDLIVSGTLQAIGTGSAPIRFQPLSGTTPGSWGQVAFLAGSSGVLNHAILEYGGSQAGLVYIASDAVQVLNSVVQYGANTGIVIQAASPLISATQILTNTGYYGGGLYNDSGRPTIQHNTFTGNSASSYYCYEMEDGPICYYIGYGGGIYNISGSPTIQNNTFTGNSAADDGGGIYNISGSPTIQNNTFTGNWATSSYGEGGGLYNDSGSPTIQNNTFIGNSAGYSGGGVFNYSGSPTIQNNTFTGNSATGSYGYGGGGVYNYSGSPTIQNNTFAGNSADYGGGIYNHSGSPTIRSNIIANSSGTGIYNSGGVPGPALDYNDVWNNSGGDYSGVTPGTHDISADPLFVDAAHGNYHLAPGSPDIDAGDPDHYSETDFDGEPRPMGLAPDIGADEYRALRIAMTGVPVEAAPGRPITYTVTLVNLTAATLTNVRVTDTLPVEAAFTGYQAAGLTCIHAGSIWGGQLTCTLGGAGLSPGAGQTLTVTAITTDTLPAPQYVTNHITATGKANGLTFAAYDQVRTWLSWCAVQLNGTPPGSDLQAAIDASSQPADVVKVSGDCRVHDLNLDKTLTLQGGWRRDFGARDPAVYTTTLDAQRLGRVLSINGVVSPAVEGFVITRGYTSNSGGGGISNGSGSPTIQNNIFTGNSADYYGGGIYNYDGSPTIQNNTFVGNSASGGGGIYNGFGNPLIQNNTFTGNSTGGYGGVVVHNNYGSPTIRSNIIANSSGTGIASLGDILALDYNDVWNNSGGDYSGVTPGVHDISADPLFVDAAHGDLHLSAGSPCIDAADPSHYPLTDFEGDLRPMGLAPDIGADEYNPLSIAMTGVPVEGSPGISITYAVTLVNLGAVTLTNVLVTDTLPVEAAFTGYQAAGLTCVPAGSIWGGQLTCTLDSANLPPSARQTLTVTAITTDTLPAPQYVINHIAATGSAGGVTFTAHDQVRTWLGFRLFLPVIRRS